MAQEQKKKKVSIRIYMHGETTLFVFKIAIYIFIHKKVSETMTSRERETMGLLCDLFNDLKELKQICYRTVTSTAHILKRMRQEENGKKIIVENKKRKANEYTYLRIFGLKDILHGKFIRFYSE